MENKQKKLNPITLDSERIFGLHWIEPHQKENAVPTKLGVKPNKTGTCTPITHTKASLGKPNIRPSTMVGGQKPGMCPTE